MSHTHTCGCGLTFECGAPILRNYDGIPEYICAADADGILGCCEACEEHGQCEDCSKTNKPGFFLCPEHQAEADDNYDGPEPDLNGTSAGEVMDAAYRLDRSQR